MCPAGGTRGCLPTQQAKAIRFLRKAGESIKFWGQCGHSATTGFHCGNAQQVFV
jgi:hypothetical protein